MLIVALRTVIIEIPSNSSLSHILIQQLMPPLQDQVTSLYTCAALTCSLLQKMRLIPSRRIQFRFFTIYLSGSARKLVQLVENPAFFNSKEVYSVFSKVQVLQDAKKRSSVLVLPLSNCSSNTRRIECIPIRCSIWTIHVVDS